MELNSRVEELEGVISELLSEKTRLEDRTSFLEKALECRSSSSEADGVTALRSASLVGSSYSATTPSSLRNAISCVQLSMPLPLKQR